MTRQLLFRPIDLCAFDPLETAGVRPDDAGVHGKSLATDKLRLQTLADDAFKHLAQHVAVAEPVVPVDRKRRMVGNLVFKAEPAKPAIDQIKLDLLAQPALRADRIAIADQENPDHQLRINRWVSGVTVIRRQFATKPSQVENRVDVAQQVIDGNAFVEIELKK